MALIERRSRYVTLPWYENLWMTTNRKRHLKSELALFQTSSILLKILAKLSGVESERIGFRRKRKFCTVFTNSIKRAWQIDSEILAQSCSDFWQVGVLGVVLSEYLDKFHNFTNLIFMTSSLQNSIFEYNFFVFNAMAPKFCKEQGISFGYSNFNCFHFIVGKYFLRS